MVDPITILSGIKLGLQTGKSVAGLSKQIGQFFDATDHAKKTLQKKVYQAKVQMLRRWIVGRNLDRLRKLKKNSKNGSLKPMEDQNT